MVGIAAGAAAAGALILVIVIVYLMARRKFHKKATMQHRGTTASDLVIGMGSPEARVESMEMGEVHLDETINPLVFGRKRNGSLRIVPGGPLEDVEGSATALMSNGRTSNVSLAGAFPLMHSTDVHITHVG